LNPKNIPFLPFGINLFFHWEEIYIMGNASKSFKIFNKNFKEENVKMKCTNNTSCIFEGIETFEGTINDTPIKIRESLLL